MDLLKDLNEVQQEAVLYTEGPLLLFAGAGSGKTKVLTHKMAFLVKNGIMPQNILAITFTNKAAKEMRQRVDILINQSADISIGTFHSICAKILRHEIHRLSYKNSFTIYDSDDQEKVIKECCVELNIDTKFLKISYIKARISALKDNFIKFEDFQKNASEKDSTISNIYTLYQQKLFEYNALDFDDIIMKVVEIFYEYDDILKKYQNMFRYILVDEYQDTNFLQYIFVKLLAQSHLNICVVGDDDQSIYSWRGADIKNILNFEKDFENTKVIKLEQNYRSTQYILKAANNLIQNNFIRKDKNLWCDHLEGEKIKFYKACSEFEEGEFICNVIETLIKEGQKYSDIAILYRANFLSNFIEKSLIKRKMPYVIYSGINFFERAEIKDLVGYLRIIYNKHDDIALKRIINLQKRGIGNVTLNRVLQYSKENQISLFDGFRCIENIQVQKTTAQKIQAFCKLLGEFIELSKTLTIFELLNEVISQTCFLDQYNQESDDNFEILREKETRLENVKNFIKIVEEFEKNHEDKSLDNFIREVSIFPKEDKILEDHILLMTVHSAKGLEFNNVFVIGFDEGIFPSEKSSTDDNKLEEERRLCYVAITRAKNILYLNSCEMRTFQGKKIKYKQSKFIDEIPKQFIHNLTFGTKKDLNDFKSQNKTKNSKTNDAIKNGYNLNILKPKKVELNFLVGDNIQNSKYGIGKVLSIKPAGADYEVTVDFCNFGKKKMMAALSKLEKYV